MVLVIWMIGFSLGSILFSFAVLLFIFKLIIHPKLTRKLPCFIKPKQLPAFVIDEIRQKLERECEKSEDTTVWLNGIVNWSFMNLSESSLFQSHLSQVISEAVVDLRRSPLGHFLLDSNLQSIELGGCAPRLQNVKLITGSSLKDPSSDSPISLRFDLDYDGVCRIVMNFDTIFKFNVIVETLVKRFAGSICLVVQDKTIHFCFLKEPYILETKTNISFMPRSNPKSKYQIPLLNLLFSSWIFRKAIKIGSCFPNFLNQWYRAGPDQPPYPWSKSVIANPDLLYNWTPKMD